jgi:hypothetical protein
VCRPPRAYPRSYLGAPSLLDLLAWRALGVACLLALSAVALNYEEAARRLGSLAGGEETLPIGEDMVAVVLALAD